MLGQDPNKEGVVVANLKGHRRWFRFSLRTLFVMLTVAAVLSLALAWYVQQPSFEVIGDLSRSDLAAICEVIAKTAQMKEKPILLIRVIHPDEVTVFTGEYDGSGKVGTLKKQSGVWTIISVGSWMA